MKQLFQALFAMTVICGNTEALSTSFVRDQIGGQVPTAENIKTDESLVSTDISLSSLASNGVIHSCIQADKAPESGDGKTFNYIFGYGSLICSKSRKISAPTLKDGAIPVVIDGIRRTWTARVNMHPKFKDAPESGSLFHGQTVMGIQKSKGHDCTGVLIEVDSTELANFDERERGYDRIEVDLQDVYPHNEDADDHIVIQKAHQTRRMLKESEQFAHDGHIGEDSAEIKVWVYMPQDGGDGANDKYPIMQSYVDIILRGCLSIGEDFAKSFLKSTHGWWHDHTLHSQHATAPMYLWVNDRNKPFYVRADEKWSAEMKHMLDELIEEVLPEPYEKRRHLDKLH